MSKHLSKILSAQTIAIMVALSVFCALSGAASSDTAGAPPIRVAVFDFDLDDRSAGAGVIPVDETDLSFLQQSAEEARRLLSESGRYEVIDTSTVSRRDLAGCDRCEGPLALKLGAEQAMLGLVTRITRTEYTIRLRVIDASTNETISQGSTGLRMGANYAWPRGVRWLLIQGPLSAE